MFRPRFDAPASAPSVTVQVAGRLVVIAAGATAAAAVFAAGLGAIRETAVGGTPRLPYCMMGVCFDCLAEIDGVPNRQACLVEVREGMRIEPQHGARTAFGSSE